MSHKAALVRRASQWRRCALALDGKQLLRSQTGLPQCALGPLSLDTVKWCARALFGRSLRVLFEAEAILFRRANKFGVAVAAYLNTTTRTVSLCISFYKLVTRTTTKALLLTSNSFYYFYKHKLNWTSILLSSHPSSASLLLFSLFSKHTLFIVVLFLFVKIKIIVLHDSYSQLHNKLISVKSFTRIKQISSMQSAKISCWQTLNSTNIQENALCLTLESTHKKTTHASHSITQPNLI